MYGHIHTHTHTLTLTHSLRAGRNPKKNNQRELVIFDQIEALIISE